ncbi:MAG TPA: metal-dependent transcriptional regulator [Solirubrobacteraceae bacterium]|nr:metal-dependent transcriptional regulator [Solirubrobacteraceae bacterium]
MATLRSTSAETLSEGHAVDHPCVEITPGEARYLLALQDLERDSPKITQAALARRLAVSRPTVLEMIRRLRQLELIEPDRVKLSVAGTSAALVLTSRRHAAQLLTHDVLGIDQKQADIEAERLTFSVSPQLGRRLAAWRDSNEQ